MYKLLKNEYIKFGNSYISHLSFFAMLLPLALTITVWYLRKDSFTTKNMYNWSALINSLQLFYSLFLGTIIPSFIAVFSVYYEIQEKTLKNLLTMPYSRIQILLSKIIYSCTTIILINIVIWIITIIFGILLGFENSVNVILSETLKLVLPNLATVIFVPIMVFLTICFKSFIHGMLLTVVCSVMN
ncbi:MAG: ABC transporter permease, partial [Clostridia bacterium]|nr:ABC transporter permease [Clostridia bacterium]